MNLKGCGFTEVVMTEYRPGRDHCSGAMLAAMLAIPEGELLRIAAEQRLPFEMGPTGFSVRRIDIPAWVAAVATSRGYS